MNLQSSHENSCLCVLVCVYVNVCHWWIASVTNSLPLPWSEHEYVVSERIRGALRYRNGCILHFTILLLPPGGWLIVTCGVTACTPGSDPSPTLLSVCRSCVLHLTYSKWLITPFICTGSVGFFYTFKPTTVDAETKSASNRYMWTWWNVYTRYKIGLTVWVEYLVYSVIK